MKMILKTVCVLGVAWYFNMYIQYVEFYWGDYFDWFGMNWKDLLEQLDNGKLDENIKMTRKEWTKESIEEHKSSSLKYMLEGIGFLVFIVLGILNIGLIMFVINLIKKE